MSRSTAELPAVTELNRVAYTPLPGMIAFLVDRSLQNEINGVWLIVRAIRHDRLDAVQLTRRG